VLPCLHRMGRARRRLFPMGQVRPRPCGYIGRGVICSLSLGWINIDMPFISFSWVSLILIPDSSPRAYGGVGHSFSGLRSAYG
jgi:hypothetical protein